MNNLIISYDLHQPDRNYEAVTEAIESLGQAIKIHQSVYYVCSVKSAREARDFLNAFIDNNDSTFVIDASKNTWAGHRLPYNVPEFLKIAWEK